VLVSAAIGFGLGFLAASPPPANPPARPAALGAPPAPGTAGAAVYEALLISDPFARTAALGQVLSGLGPEDLESVRVVYASVVTSPTDPEIVMLAQWWAQYDPEGAFAWARSSTAIDPALAIPAVLRTWAHRDPDAAGDAVFRLGRVDKAAIRAALVAVARGWEEGGHPDLPRVFHQLPQGIEMQVTVDAIVRRKALRHGSAEAFRWAESLPPDTQAGGLKVNSMRRVASAVAEFDPAAAMAFVEKHRGNRDAHGSLRRVGVALGIIDGERGMQWIATLPEGDDRTTAAGATYRSWIATDRAAAMRWMRGQQTGPWLDFAVSAFTQALSHDEPELALAWAAQITDEKVRFDASWRVGRVWLREDPVPAQTWLESADISEALKQKITLRQQRAKQQRPKAKPRGATGKAGAPSPDA